MKRWLWSVEAIQVHVLCLTCIGVLGLALLSGDWKDYALALAAVVVAYPALLWLVRSKERADERDRQVLQSLPVAEARHHRAAQRAGMTIFAALVGGLLIALGVLLDVEAYGLPAQYLGFIVLGMATLGVCGVNVWYGGPLDPRQDPRPESVEDN
jgi:F0F1-type ATP synthase assembly protein I